MSNQFTADQARSYKRYAVNGRGNKQDFIDDLHFVNDPKIAQKAEAKQTLKNIQDQINYFGYEIEPFNMKFERDCGQIDTEGHFLLDRQKDKDINDAWLDQLDQQNIFKDLQEKAQNEGTKQVKKNIKEQNKAYKESNQGAQFFKSNRFSNPMQAQQHYNPEELKSDEEIEIPQSKVIVKQQVEKGLDLYELETEQIKEILVELLNEGETPNQAIKRLKEASQVKQKQTFKKNVRKQVKTEQNVQVDQEKVQDSKQSMEMIIDLCTVILSKTNNPDIYNTDKSKLQQLQEIEQVDEPLEEKQELSIREQEIQKLEEQLKQEYIKEKQMQKIQQDQQDDIDNIF